MKKFLLSMLCMAGAAMMAQAETVTFDFSGDNGYGMTLLSGSTNEYNEDGYTCTEGDVTITLNGNTRWWANNNGNQLRFYKGSSMTVNAGGQEIKKIEFTPTSIKMSDCTSGVWTGSATSVTLSATNTSGNTYCNQIKVTYGEDAGITEPDPELPVVENLYMLTDAPNGTEFVMGTDLTVVYANGAYVYVYDGLSYGLIYKNGLNLSPALVIAAGWNAKVSIYNGLLEIVPKDDYLVCTTGYGNVPAPLPVEAEDAPYVVAAYNQSAYVQLLGVTFTSATPAANVTSSADRTFTGTMGDNTITFFQRFGLESVEAGEYNVTGFVAVYGDVVQVYPTAFEKIGGSTDPEPDPELPVLESLTMLADAPNGTEFEMGIDLTVVYANGAYVYVYDGVSYGLIYKYDLGLAAGDVIAKGWKAKVSIYNNLIEIVPNDATLATTGTAGTVPSPLQVEAEDAQWVIAPYNQNLFVKLMEVTFDTATPAADAASADRTYTGKMGDFEVTFYQRFGLESVEPGTYNVTGFVSVYKEDVQVYPITIDKTTGISSIATDEAGARYYNINGIEVANPTEGGLYIRVANGKATKVIK